MDMINEIREGFASVSINEIRKLHSLPIEYPAYVLRLFEGYGVALKVSNDLIINEHFNNCRLHTCMIGSKSGNMGNYLVLSSSFEEYRYEFAALCAELVEPGREGSNRHNILADPYKWWEGWKKLVGNANQEDRVYNVIAEMMVLDYKLYTDPDTIWAATTVGSHDIECGNESGEVKSTIKRYGYEIEIAGQHQLKCKNRLYLYFLRMEESLEGESINSMKKILVAHGYNEGKLEQELEAQGFEVGSNIRNKKYKVLEKRKYLVDDSFPKITEDSFKDNKYPDAIVRIGYAIDLQAVGGYEQW